MTIKDPRRIRGDMAGPGGPHDRGGVVLDTRHAVLLKTVDVSTLDPDDPGTRGQSAIALVLGGRINQTQDQASVLFLFGTDGAASIITELIALLGRATGIDADQLMTDLLDRAAKLREEGNLS
jgi:hypothetical protein